MNQMTRAIYEKLSADEDLKVFTEEHGESSEVWLQFGIDNGGSYRIHFINSDNDNDTSVRVYALTSVDDARRGKMLETLNRLNNKYRFFKFVIDGDNDVNIEYDYLVHCPNPAASANEIVIRIVRIVDEIYPELMRTLWGG